MRKGHLLFSAVEFLLVAALFLIGAAFFGLHVSDAVRSRLASWIIEGQTPFLLMGLLVTSVALLLGICFGMMQRGSFVRFKGKGFSLDEALVRSAMLEFWKEELPQEVTPSEIYCAKGKIEVITSDLKEDLDEVEGRLGFFLAKHFGYDREFFITISHR